MRVLQIFEPGCDGVFRHVEQLCTYLHKKGVETDLLYSSRRGSGGLQDLVQQHHARGALAEDLEIGPSPSFADLGAAMEIVRTCRRKRYDVIHAHSSKAGALVRLVAPFLNPAAIFYTPHAYFGMGEVKSWRSRFYNGVEIVLSRVGQTINISPDEATFGTVSLHRNPSSTVVIPNPVDSARFQPPSHEQIAAARARFGLALDARVIAYAGRFSVQKDPLVAFRAFAECARKDTKVHLLYLSKPTQRAEASAFFSAQGLCARVTYVDYLEDVRPFYHSADLFLLTSRYEAGWPFVVLEAMACNLPIVTSACLGMSDIRESGLSKCWAFEVGSTEGCSAALQAALQSEGASNHREIAIRRFSVDHCFGGVHRLYQGAVTNETAVAGTVSAISV